MFNWNGEQSAHVIHQELVSCICDKQVYTNVREFKKRKLKGILETCFLKIYFSYSLMVHVNSTYIFSCLKCVGMKMK